MLELLLILNAALIVACTGFYFRIRQLESAERARQEATAEELQDALLVLRAARARLAANEMPSPGPVEEAGWGRRGGGDRRAAI